MKLKLYCFRDKLVGFWKPFVSHSDATARREFAMAVASDPDGVSVPDMDLYRVGEFDDQTGVIVSDVEFLVNGSSFLKE